MLNKMKVLSITVITIMAIMLLFMPLFSHMKNTTQAAQQQYNNCMDQKLELPAVCRDLYFN